MKAIRKSDGKVIEVTERTSWNGEKIYTADGTFYRKHELDFSVDKADEAEGDLRISVAKLRNILEDVASSQFVPRVLDDGTIDEIINQVNQSVWKQT